MCIIDHYPLGNQRTQIPGGLNIYVTVSCFIEQCTLQCSQAGASILTSLLSQYMKTKELQPSGAKNCNLPRALHFKVDNKVKSCELI